MRKFLVASHGYLAKEMVNSAEMIIGENTNIDYVCLTPKDSQEIIKDKIKTLLEGDDEENELLILTDFFGGSVSNACVEYVSRKNVYLITGINLPMLLELLLSDKNKPTDEVIKYCIRKGTEGIIFVNELVKNNNY